MKKLSPKTIRLRLNKLQEWIDYVEENMKKLKSRCSHKNSVSYSSDPSGNNDTSYDCRACGASWRYWPKDVDYEFGIRK